MIGIGASRAIRETLGNTHLGCSFGVVFCNQRAFMMLQPCACVCFCLCFKFLVCSVSRGFSYVLERVCWCLTLYVLLHVAQVHFVYCTYIKKKHP